jgi:small GTP-binding protein
MTSKKIILTGSFGVGKTSIFNQFMFQKFSDKYLTTIGVKVNKKVVKVNEEEVSLLVWDIAGEVTQDKVPTSYFLGASGIIYVIDLSRPLTFEKLDSDIAYLTALLPGAVIKIVGNKKDLLSEKELEETLKVIPKPLDSITSAKTGESVEELFTSLAEVYLIK